MNKAVLELSKDLKDRYDCIIKIDAIHYLKSISNASIKDCIDAYKLAFGTLNRTN